MSSIKTQRSIGNGEHKEEDTQEQLNETDNGKTLEEARQEGIGQTISRNNEKTEYQEERTTIGDEWLANNFGCLPEVERQLIKPGRPHGTQRPLSWTTRFFAEWRQKVTDDAFNFLCWAVRQPEFDWQHFPRTLHRQKQVEEDGYPSLAVWMTICKTKPGKRKKDQKKRPRISVFFADIIELIAMIFGNSVLKESLITKYRGGENQIIEHPADTIGWLHLQSKCDLLSLAHRKQYILVPVILMIDGYSKQGTLKQGSIAIFMTIANLPSSVLRSSQHKYLISLLPLNAHLNNALKTIVVEPLRRLERGCTIHVGLGESLNICGSLYCLVGDHPGQAAVLGLVGPRGLYPCRHCLVKDDELHLLPQDGFSAPQRDPVTTKHNLDEYKSLSRSTREKLLREQGLRHYSALFELRWIQQDLFERVGICYLHQSIEGNFVRHTKYILAKFKIWEEINELVGKGPRYPTLRSLKRGVMEPRGSKKNPEKVELKMLTRNGEEIESWIQVSAFLLIGRVPLLYYACWIEHIEIDFLLYTSSIRRDSLPHLQQRLDKWAQLFRALYHSIEFAPHEDDDDEEEEEEKVEDNTEEEEFEESNDDEIVDDDSSNEDDEQNEVDDGAKISAWISKDWSSYENARFTVRYPNFHTDRHRARCIAFLGPAFVFNAAPFETNIAAPKHEVTNNREPQRDIYSSISERVIMQLSNPNPAIDRLKHPKEDLTPFGTSKISKWSKSTLQEFLTIRRAMGLEENITCEYQTFSGFYFGGVRVMRGQYLRIEDCRVRGRLPPMIPNEQSNGSIIFARFEGIRRTSTTEGYQGLWARITLLEPSGDDPRSLLNARCPAFKKGTQTWIPFSRKDIRRVHIRNLIQVIPHPLKRGILLYNRWIRKEVGPRE
jgi:hypothetical protein